MADHTLCQIWLEILENCKDPIKVKFWFCHVCQAHLFFWHVHCQLHLFLPRKIFFWDIPKIVPFRTKKTRAHSHCFPKGRLSWSTMSRIKRKENQKKENQLLYFVWSPPWHLYIFLLANLLAFYLTYLLAFYLAYLLAYILTYLRAFYLAFYLAYLLAFYLTYLLAFYLAYLLAYILTYLLAFYLVFYLAYLLAYLLAFYLAYVLAYLLAFYLAFYLAYLLAYYLANLLGFYLAYLVAFYLTFYLAFYLAYLLAFYLAYLLAFYLAVEVQRCTLRYRSGNVSVHPSDSVICSNWLLQTLPPAK